MPYLGRCYPHAPQLTHLRHHNIILQIIRHTTTCYVSGQGWTGALGTGLHAMIDPLTSDVSDHDRDHLLTEVLMKDTERVMGCAAGWGHSTLLVQNTSNKTTRVLMAGRPYDFRTLLRWKRLPAFVRRLLLKNTLRNNKDIPPMDTVFERLANTFFGGKIQSQTIPRDKVEDIQNIYPSFTEMSLPKGERPALPSASNHPTIATSAGMTAIISRTGTLYTFGVNHRGQCGIGTDRPHVYMPTAVRGCHTRGFFMPHNERRRMTQEHKIQSVVLGLQHGLALDVEGNVYSWGKGTRGQLGVRRANGDDVLYKNVSTPIMVQDDEYEWIEQGVSHIDHECAAMHIRDFLYKDDCGKLYRLTDNDKKVTQISAGWNHSAAITANNQAWIWGKNFHPSSSSSKSKQDDDAILPHRIQGLPPTLQIMNITCGSHHTSILMEDGSVYGLGVTSDTIQVEVEQAVEMLPRGFLEGTPREFRGHFDRTTIVEEGGKAVWEIKFYGKNQRQKNSMWKPAWVEELLVDHEEGVKMVSRGWLHSLIVME